MTTPDFDQPAGMTGEIKAGEIIKEVAVDVNCWDPVANS